MMVLSLIFQTVWAQEMARWTVLTGEHGVKFNSRIISSVGALVSITFFMFIAFAIPAWASVAATALLELVKWPAAPEIGTVFWAYVSFLLVFAVVFLSKVARSWIERIATGATLLAWGLAHHRGRHDDQVRDASPTSAGTSSSGTSRRR